jgi:hypothetical protein
MVPTATALATIDARDANRIDALVSGVVVVLGLIISLLLVQQA